MNNERFNNITARYLQGIASGEEEQELLTAIRSSDTWSAAFRAQTGAYRGEENSDEIDRKWNRLAARITPPAEAQQPANAPTTRFFALSNRKFRIWMAAAVILACLSGLSVFFLKHTQTDSAGEGVGWHTLTAAADDRTVILPDSTSVYLRKGAVLQYAGLLEGPVRQVALQGEAFFDVTHDAEKPFIVDAAQLSVKVLGTSFSVSALDRGETISVILATGSVSVRDALQKELVRLAPNQKVDYSVHSGQYTVTEVDSERATSWRKGIVAYDNASLPEIVDLIEQTYGVKLHYAAPGSEADQRFSGAFFKKQKLDTVLELTGRLTGTALAVKK